MYVCVVFPNSQLVKQIDIVKTSKTFSIEVEHYYRCCCISFAKIAYNKFEKKRAEKLHWILEENLTFLRWFSSSSSPARIRQCGSSKNWTSQSGIGVRITQIIVDIIVIDPFMFFALSCSISSQSLQFFFSILHQWTRCFTWKVGLHLFIFNRLIFLLMDDSVWTI